MLISEFSYNPETMTTTVSTSNGLQSNGLQWDDLQWETPFEVSWDDSYPNLVRFNREDAGELQWNESSLSPTQDVIDSMRKDLAMLFERVIKMSVEMDELKLIKVRFEELNAKLKEAMSQCTTISEEDIADILGFGL